ncbi:hypothetical protein [Paraclostridium dentum]|uniref:hypothetical protein n=1 Tax=Paraclostridium dentum TaxID=2662455 RepID=UPI003AFFFE59
MDKWRNALKIGREIEFEYNNRVYFIGNYDEGRCIFNDVNEEVTKYYTDIDLFLDEVSIDECLLNKLIKSDSAKIITIF